MIPNMINSGRRGSALFALMALAIAAGADVPGAAADRQIAQASANGTIYGLRQSGWVVTERTETIDRQPGLPPYEMKDRNILITTFVLEKGGQRKRCTLAYDSQLERFEEACRDAQ